MRTIVCLMSFAILAFGQLNPLSMEPNSWDLGDSHPLAGYEFKDDVVRTASGRAEIGYGDALFSDDCEIEAVVTLRGRSGGLSSSKGWALGGVKLESTGGNYWHLALSESPSGSHHIEMHQMHEGRWTFTGNIDLIHWQDGRFAWEYGTGYRLNLKLKNGEIIGTVTSLDGKQIYKRHAKFKEGTPEYLVRPALTSTKMEAEYRELKGRWIPGNSRTEKAPAKLIEAKNYESDNFVPTVQGKATGFFHLTKTADGKDWMIDPLGRGFVVLGCGSVNYMGPECEKLACFPYKVNNDKQYASRDAWAEEVSNRLKAWGFNFVGGGDSEVIQRGFAYARFINIGGAMASYGDEFDITPNNNAPCTAFPNVFHPRFRDWCEYRARLVCGPYVNDPWLVGYFIDNELAWWGRGKPATGLFNAVMQKNAKHTAKLALRDFLKRRVADNIADFNRLWKTELKDFDGILELAELPEETAEQVQAKVDFLALIADIYFGESQRAFRQVDKNHLLMGCRFAGIGNTHDVVWQAIGKYNDCVTINMYGSVDLDAGTAHTSLREYGKPLTVAFEEVHEKVGLPIIMTEWSFPALDSGLPCTKGAGQRFQTQRERTIASEIYARTILSMPFMVGYVYFKWVDQPALGVRSTAPEDSNYGLVTMDNKPYTELTSMFARLHREVKTLRDAKPPAAKEQPDRSVGSFLPRHTVPVARLGKGENGLWHRRNGDGTVEGGNGRLTIRSQANSGFLDVLLDGNKLARFNVMLNYMADDGMKQVYSDATRVLSAQCGADGERLLMEFHVEKRGASVELASDLTSFEVKYRLTIVPNADWFCSEILETKNTSGKTMELRGLFFRLFPSFESEPLALQSAVPNLWGAPLIQAWMAKDGKAYVGVCARQWTQIRSRYWIDKNNGKHPDSFRKLEESVPENSIYVPQKRFYLFNYLGTGTDVENHAAQILKWDAD